MAHGAHAQSDIELLDLAFDAPSVALEVQQLRDGQRVVAGEALVVLDGTVSRANVHAALREVGYTVLGSVPALGIYRIQLPPGIDAEQSIECLSRVPGIGSAERHRAMAAFSSAAAPDDTWFHLQWQHMSRGTMAPVNNPTADVVGANVLQAWQVTPGSEESVVAILDTGIDLTHPELAGRLLPGYDFVHEDDDPMAVDSHGLRVALVLAANGDNAFGTVGVDQRCKLVPVQVLSFGGFEFDIIQGLEYAVRRGVNIINCSFILNNGSSAAAQKAIDSARDHGVIIVAGAGNAVDGSGFADKNGMGGHPATISVGATDRHGNRAFFSATGTALDFVAPGERIVIAWPLNDGTDSYIEVSGTSGASPMVAGIVSLMKAIHPDLTPDQAYAALRAAAVDEVGDPTEDAPGWDKYYGHGLVNAAKALDYLCQCLDDPTFSAAPASLDLQAGGTVSFRIDAGREHAGGMYLLLGTASGTSPASPIGMTRWPLVSDAYTHLSLAKANQPPWTANLGMLDDAGRATVSLAIPAMLPDVLGGVTLDHAAAVWAEDWVRPLHVPATLVSGPRRLQLRLPPQVVFSEDFEDGLAGWSVQSDGPAAWHLAEDGECGAESRMAAFNEAATCSFTPATPTESRLLSPSFTFSKDSPFTLEFDMVRDFAGGSLSTIQVEIVDETATAALVTQKVANYQLTNGEWGTGLVHVRVQVPQSSKFEGRTVHLEFVGSSKEPAPATGWLVDNIVIRDLGALPNSSGP